MQSVSGRKKNAGLEGSRDHLGCKITINEQDTGVA